MTDTTDQKSETKTRLQQLMKPSHRLLKKAAACSVAASILWYGQAAIIASLFSDLILETEPVIPFIILALLFLLLGVGRAALKWKSGALSFTATDQIIANERRQLISRESLASPIQQDVQSAEIAALLGDKLKAVSPYLMHYIPAFTRVRILPVITLCIAFSISWAAGLIFLITGPLIPLFMALVGMAAKEASEKQMQEISNLNILLVERLRALTDIRLLNATAYSVRSLQNRASQLRIQTMNVLKVAFLSSTILELFAAIGVALMAVYIGFSLLGELNFGTYGSSLTLFQGLFLLLLTPDYYQPLRDLAASWHDKAAAAAVAEDLIQIEKRPLPTISGQGLTTTALTFNRPLSSAGVRFKLPSSNVIAFPDFKIQPGQTMAITGPSGSGKSTYLAILAGLLNPAEGEIKTGPDIIALEAMDEWRANIAWISQTPYFLNASLLDNLTCGRDNVGHDDLQAALRQANAAEIVDRLPKGLDTQLGENGHGVSGGEARRLMIARAILSGKPVIFADEPTADLDAETARNITNSLLSLAQQGATLIVATHDLNLAGHMDQQVVLGSQK